MKPPLEPAGSSAGQDTAPVITGGDERIIDLRDGVVPGVLTVASTVDVVPVVAGDETAEAERQLGKELDQAERIQHAARRYEDAVAIPTGIEELARVVGGETVDESGVDIAEKFESQGYVRRAPKFIDQMQDETRHRNFVFFKPGNAYENAEEHEGLVDLGLFLNDFLLQTDTRRGKGIGSFTTDEIAHLREHAQSMLDNLTFIGSVEYDEAVTGVGTLWKSYLDADPGAQICVIAGETDLDRYSRPDIDKPPVRKSDDWVREDVLLTFTDEEREKYSDRIVTALSAVTASPEKAKIILVDDWSMSGTQLRDVAKSLMQHPSLLPYAEAGALEINLVVASEERVRTGLRVNPDDEASSVIPVKSYFLAHDAPVVDEEHHAHITGLHSSVNYGFRDECIQMGKVTAMIRQQKKVWTPLLKVEPFYHMVEPVYDTSTGRPIKVGPQSREER